MQSLTVGFAEGFDHLAKIVEDEAKSKKQEMKAEEEGSELILKKNQKHLRVCQKRRGNMMLYWTQLTLKLLL